MKEVYDLVIPRANGIEQQCTLKVSSPKVAFKLMKALQEGGLRSYVEIQSAVEAAPADLQERRQFSYGIPATLRTMDAGASRQIQAKLGDSLPKLAGAVARAGYSIFGKGGYSIASDRTNRTVTIVRKNP